MPAPPLEDDWLESVPVAPVAIVAPIPVEEESAALSGVVEEPGAVGAVVDPESALPDDVIDDVSVDDPLLAASEPATVAIPPFDNVCDRNPSASGAWTLASAWFTLAP